MSKLLSFILMAIFFLYFSCYIANNSHMSIQSDIRKLLSETGISQQELAKMAGVNSAALSRFLNREGCSIAERLVPFVYGEKRLVPPTPPEKEVPHA